ncbi:MAG: hypothetical protein GY723_14360 [bacterium]|nr:hypothetical protein [bacterium]MCP5069954.1 hypothetical protein [bacterium]
MSSDDQTLPDEEIARLAVMRRLSMGTAHAVNNALTVAMGEAGFLYEDNKENPEIVEACQAILSSVDRCARLTQAVLAHSNPTPTSGETGTDLVRAVRDLERWLREAIGSRNSLRVDAPDSLVLVAAPDHELELLIMGLVAFAADQTCGAADLLLRVETSEAGESAAIQLTVSCDELLDDFVASLEDPSRASEPRDRLLLRALRGQVAKRGGSWHAARIDPQSLSLIVRLPASD